MNAQDIRAWARTCGRAVRQMREAAGLTQKMLGYKIRSTQQAIARIESGKSHPPTTLTLLRVARATGHSLELHFERETDV